MFVGIKILTSLKPHLKIYFYRSAPTIHYGYDNIMY